MNEYLQLKPYLDVRNHGSILRVGNTPSIGVEIEDAPDLVIELLDKLSDPTSVAQAVDFIKSRGALSDGGAEDLLGQLEGSGVIGEPIPSDGRYARHLLYFDMIGVDCVSAQERLRNATIGVVGTGGIGTNVAMVLAAAGVGRLVITDGDTIELSNLTRQFLYTESDIGIRKVEVAERRLRALNSEVSITAIPAAASPELLKEGLTECDFVVLSADSPDELREWIDDAARESGFGYLVAGYVETVGSVGPMVLPGLTGCYGCMLRSMADDIGVRPDEMVPPNLNRSKQAGSFGPLNSIVAAMAANEVVRFLVGAPCSTAGVRLQLDSQNYRLYRNVFGRRDDCAACGGVRPKAGWESAVEQPALEDVYEESRTSESINSVVLDEFLAGLTAQLISDRKKSASSMRALDFGCGSGENLAMLAASFGEVVGVDKSTRMLELCRRRVPLDGGATVTLAHVDDESEWKSRFDLILCTNVLDHIRDLDAVLHLLSSSLTEEGTLVATIPHPIKDGGVWHRGQRGGLPDYTDFRIEDYFTEGTVTKSRESSSGDIVIDAIATYHRTIESYVQSFLRAGFSIQNVFEPRPDTSAAAEHPVIWSKTSRVPYFLTFVLGR
ncbi:ThiF family adenylyltransferase [Nocardia vaccinii]|uniref:ThiF family adenylyltransferase n=1 Tax=Nocardia vaccinii TaxID=1822 RepID=UPI000831BBE3|nr:ThiF family adenylyltransferase [Nocardia vaccinii]